MIIPRAPRPWRVQAVRYDHANQCVVPWNGLDKRADGFEVVDAAGELVGMGFSSRANAQAYLEAPAPGSKRCPECQSKEVCEPTCSIGKGGFA